MSCEIGVPKYLLIDSDDAIKKALRELEVDVKDLEFKLHKEKGIVFDVCPVAGHNAHGQWTGRESNPFSSGITQ